MEKDFKFLLLTDTHYFKNSLGAYGKAYDERIAYEQKCYAETEAINRVIFDYLKEFDETDTILIAGDLSFNGEKESHEDFSQMLKELKATGKKIYVVTAGHDIGRNPTACPGTDKQVPVEGIKFGDLLSYYGEFGYDTAIEFNREHMSYVAQLADGIRLLVICNDTVEGNNIAYSDEFFGWMEAQIKKAKDDGQMIFAMEHYPVIPGQPILRFIGDAYQKDSARLIRTLADNGCHLCFTGHMHNQSINLETTEKGNKFYDVCTGSAIGCPAFMRLCTIKDENTIDIKSIPIPEFNHVWDTNGRTGEKYLQDLFDRMIINLLTGLKDDPVRTMKKIRMKQTKLTVSLMQKLGNAVCTKTVGQTVKIFGVKAEAGIADKPLLEFLTEIVRYTFTGNQPYTEDTPGGKTFLKVIRRFNPVLKILNKKVHGAQGEQLDLYDMIKNTIGNYEIDDYNAELKLN